MFNDALWVLLITTFVVAATHTLSPDHWFGFVMLGRTRKWGLSKTLTVAGIAGIGHVGTSAVISLVAIWAGAALAQNFTSVAEVITGWALVIFGLGFALYSYLKGGHAHHGILFVNRLFNIDTREAEALMHVHDPGDHDHDHDHMHHHHDHHNHNHGHDPHHDDDDHDHAPHHHDHDHSPTHDHPHTDDGHHHDHACDLCRKNGSKMEAGYGLVAIIALTPCVLLMPLALRAGEMGMDAVLWTILVFFVATIATILFLVAACLKGLEVIRFEFFEKFGEVITGLVIGFMGVMVVAGFI